jgi:beta-xylosidase
MKKVFLLIALFSKVAFAQTTKKSEGFYTNPVIPLEYADPTIIKVGKTYYSAATTNDWAPHFPMHRSTDLVNWEFMGYVFDKNPDWTSGAFWAPEFLYYKGKYYCYYTARRKSDGISCIGVATTEDLKKGFTDHGMLVEWGKEAIDSYVVEDEGKLYITWKAYGLDKGKIISIMGSELTEDGLRLKGEPFLMLEATRDGSNWENGGIEGQCIVKRAGYFYMLYSGNGCCGTRCDYQVGVARAKDIKGPWEKYGNNPIMAGDNVWKCGGHGTLVQTDDDRWFYHYHAYRTKEFVYTGRQGMLDELVWNADGWPQFKNGTKPSVQAPLPFPTKTNALPALFYDDFTGKKLGRLWQWNFTNHVPVVTVSKGNLILAKGTSGANNVVGSAISVTPAIGDYTVTTTVNGKANNLRGLVIYGGHDNSFGLGIEGNNLVLWQARNGKYETLKSVPFGGAKNPFLKANVSDGKTCRFFYSLNNKNWTPVGEQTVWWDWTVRPGLFNHSDKGEEASFPFFRMEYKK